MGWFCPFTGWFLDIFREGVYIILKFSTGVHLELSTQIFSVLAPKWLLLLSPSPKIQSQLCSSGDLPLRAEEWIHWQQEFCISDLTHLGHFSADVPAVSPTLAPFSCPARCKTLCCGLMSSCCHTYAYPSCWCLLYLPLEPQNYA